MGDYAYSCDFQRFIDTAQNIAFIGVLGNHDDECKNSDSFRKIIEFMGLDQDSDYYFAKEIGPVLITGMNHYIDSSKASTQYEFMEDALKNSTQKFKVVVAHEPAITPEVEGGHDAKTGFLRNYEPLWKQYGVDLVIVGHNHIYGWQNNQGEGIDYLICGQGGKGNDEVGDKRPFDDASADPFGFCKLTFNSDNERIKLEIMNSQSLNSTGHGKVIKTANLRN